MAILRLSSKNHVDVPVWVHGHQLHLLLSHPTPPVFDGPENRNGRRNHDEIRLWSDYLSGGERANYLIDDAGKSGGLHSEDLFVVLGDLNADPFDGDSYNRAISQLLEHKRIHPAVWLDKQVPRSKAGNSRNPKILRTGEILLKTPLLGGYELIMYSRLENWKFCVAEFSGPNPMKPRQPGSNQALITA